MRTGSDSDGDANGEDFLVYGRPFPAIEDIHEDKNQFQPVWKQEVNLNS
jgi:hypothetical protein